MAILCWALGLFILCSQTLTAAPRSPQTQAVLRTEGGLNFMSLSPSKKLLAFTDDQGRSLRIMDLGTQDVVEVTPHKVGPGFFWSPDGVRLFFRELVREGDRIASDLCAFDSVLNQRLVLDSISGSTGYPTFNPYDYNLYLMHEKGILQKRLEFPGERFAKWQKEKKSHVGNWVVSQTAVLWLGELGLELQRMKDDNTGVQSYAQSPDGRRIAWATQGGRIYAAIDGGDVQFIGEGRDPSWHPFRTLLLYAGARKIGAQTYDYDLRFTNLAGVSRTLTQTQDIKERWPVWLDANTVLYTAQGTTDLFRLNFAEASAVAQKPKGPGSL